jgi:hypothetical protein
MTLGSGKEWTRRAEDLDARTTHREHDLALGAVGAGPWPELVVDVERAARREADAQAPPSRPSSGGRREVAVGLALPEISGEPLPVAGGDKARRPAGRRRGPPRVRAARWDRSRERSSPRPRETPFRPSQGVARRALGAGEPEQGYDPGNAVGLLQERDTDPFGKRHVGHGHQIA